jgi:hypothetical protein
MPRDTFLGSDADRAAIKRLDVAWAMRCAEAEGRPFKAAKSKYYDRHDNAETVALMALRGMRIHVGNKKEARASKVWLAAHGVAKPTAGGPFVQLQTGRA